MSITAHTQTDSVTHSLAHSLTSDPYEEIDMSDILPLAQHPPLPDGDPPPISRANPLYSPDEQSGPQTWVNPDYQRLTQSDDPVAPVGDLDNPVHFGQVPDLAFMPEGGSLPHVAHTTAMTESDLAIMLQGGSLPHVAHTTPVTETELQVC